MRQQRWRACEFIANRMRLERLKAASGLRRTQLSLAHFAPGVAMRHRCWTALSGIASRPKSRALCYNSEVRGRRKTNETLLRLRKRTGRRIPLLCAARRGEAGHQRLRKKSFRRPGGSVRDGLARAVG